MMFQHLFRADATGKAARQLYNAVVAQARLPAFYRHYGVPDTLDGRFDMVVLHAFLLLHRLKRDGAAQGPVGQALFDLMFADMDASLRELGVGDLSVGRKVKQMATGFYGRVAAYDQALSPQAPPDVLDQALRRNLYGTVQVSDQHVAAMAAYVRMQAAWLDGRPGKTLMEGVVEFCPPEGPPI
jgi:cytochrome b pre-mRNA-processing protein 3